MVHVSKINDRNKIRNEGKRMQRVEKYKKEVNEKAIYSTKQIAMDAMWIALTLIFTAFVNVQIPAFGGAGGLVHLGNVPLFVAAMLFGKRTGALAGGIGMGLFDILTGWIAWAPCTILTCGLMGMVVGAICEKKKTMLAKVVAMVLALMIKIAGYFFYESFLLGNGMMAAIKSIPGNCVQVITAALLVFLIIKPLEKSLEMLK